VPSRGLRGAVTKVRAGRLGAGTLRSHALAAGRGAWLQVACGSVTLNGVELGPGAGAAVENEPTLEVRAVEAAEVLLFDLA